MEKIERIKELESEVAEMRDFIENASIPLHWVNGSGIVIWVNQAELDLLGYTKEEYLGSHISNFHADKDVIEDILTRLIKKETLLNYPARLKCKNGDIKFVLINSNVLWKENQFIHTRCFSRDISDLKKIERQKVETVLELQNKNHSLRVENTRLLKELETLKQL